MANSVLFNNKYDVVPLSLVHVQGRRYANELGFDLTMHTSRNAKRTVLKVLSTKYWSTPVLLLRMWPMKYTVPGMHSVQVSTV